MPTVPFDVDLLKELREHARVFIKLDLAYLVAAGAIYTALKFGREDLYEIGSEFQFVAFAFVFLLGVDATLDSIVFEEWLRARTGGVERQATKAIKLLLGVQPILHVLFVCGLIMYFVGMASGAKAFLAEFEGKVLLQEQLEQYMKDKGSPARSLDELKSANPRIDAILAKLHGENVKIETTGKKSYRITFAGQDNIFGTADDETETQDLQLRKVYDRFLISHNLSPHREQ